MAPNNRTLRLSDLDRQRCRERLISLESVTTLASVLDRTICQDLFAAVPRLPRACVDLLVLDPPYNLTKTFSGSTFSRRGDAAYGEWVEAWLVALLPCLKATASVYVCGDWTTSMVLQPILNRHFTIRNRITWEREKGRGAKANWKNASEDIWFCTVGKDYWFDVDAVKLRRQVIAPYTVSGKPKDWRESAAGRVRDTHPSNLWTDVTVPFWSMTENTDHPTQKPEKLIAKLILASCPPEGLVLDPFLGSGTTSVVARKLGRHFVGIEQELEYCCLAERRLELALEESSIQGYEDGVFWERNSRRSQRHSTGSNTRPAPSLTPPVAPAEPADDRFDSAD